MSTQNQNSASSSTPTIALACDLIRRPSITPLDENCQQVMIDRLQAIGFECQNLQFDDILNFWAVKKGTSPTAKTLAFAGHTDVVPTGDESAWTYPPFDATIVGDMLYGRGTADMKGSLAAMITACEAFLADNPTHEHNIAFLITSDEEGIAVNGTVKVVEWLKESNIPLEYCIVGEPSSTDKVGDIVKNGRRGSLNAKLKIHGKQGHIAYPHLANNPIHLTAPVLAELASLEWDKGNDHFPPTSFQVSNINSGTGATNVIPNDAEIVFNFRYSTETTYQKLQQTVEACLNKHHVNHTIDWTLSGEPFLTSKGALIDAVQAGIQSTTGYETTLSTSGGTSDGRFIAKLGTEIVELGPCNATIHQIDECVSISELNTLHHIYTAVLINIVK